ncbi:hypothetical protein BgiBS90_007201 [Biomphalaria glabrata]|nr:hypothetical protein BgiBS90_007201 [Biomphalaria glabrata]
MSIDHVIVPKTYLTMCSSAKVMTDRRHSRRKSMARAKLWTQVNKGVARLQPLLGEFKPVNGMMKTVTNTAPPSNRARTSSVKYPCLNKSLRTMSFEAAYGEGPADINFLKNKLGFCIPSEELILRSQTLRLTSEWHPPRSFLDDLTSSSALKNITSLTNRKSFLDSVKSDQRRASFRMDSQKLGHHMSLDENYGKPYNAQYGKPYNAQYGKPYNAQYGKPYNAQYGKPYNAQYGKPYNAQYGKPYNAQYGKPYNAQYGKPYNAQYGKPYNAQNGKPYNAQYGKPYNAQYGKPYNAQYGKPYNLYA